MKEVFNRYYTSIGVPNPFETKKPPSDTYQQGVVPSQSVVVKDGTTKSKNVITPTVVTDIQQLPEPPVAEPIIAPPPPMTKEQEIQLKIDKIKKTLAGVEVQIEIASSDAEKQMILQPYINQLEALDLIPITPGSLADEKKKLLTDFIAKNIA